MRLRFSTANPWQQSRSGIFGLPDWRKMPMRNKILKEVIPEQTCFRMFFENFSVKLILCKINNGIGIFYE